MSETVTLSTDFVITIPKSVIEAQKWRPGQELTFIRQGGSVMIVAVPNRDELYGIARGADPNGYRDRNDRY